MLSLIASTLATFTAELGELQLPLYLLRQEKGLEACLQLNLWRDAAAAAWLVILTKAEKI